MLFSALQTIYYFITAITLYVLGLRRLNPRLYWCGRDLVAKPEGTFRIDKQSYGDMLFMFRMLNTARYKLFTAERLQYHVSDDTKTALYDEVKTTEMHERTAFIKAMTGAGPGMFISKEEILQYPRSISGKLLLLGMLCVYTILLLPFVFSHKRSLYAFTILEAAECAVLLTILKKHHIKELYYSCIFEKDANICALVLIKNGIHVTKNPSEDPLYFNNQVIVADTLALCNAYHEEEVPYYSDTMFINDTVRWLPEQSLKYMHKYPNSSLQPKRGTLGYYGGSSWVRLAYNFSLTSGKYDPYKAEFELIEYLRDYLYEHPDVSFTIFMHPIERRNDEIYEKAKQYYAEHFKGISYKLADRDTVTGMALEDVDVAIAVFSGAITYRLYGGFKGLFYTPYMPGYPIKNSSMDHICAADKKSLFDKLDKTLNINTEDFFTLNKLNHYSYNHFQPINQ